MRNPGYDKKAFLSDQCREIEENIRMGKTTDLFKKIRNTKVTFHAKMGTIKKRSQKQRRKGKIYPIECRVPNNSKKR